MKLNAREKRLALITLVALWLGGTYWVGEPRFFEWRQNQEQIATLQQQREHLERLLERSDDLTDRLEELRKDLPRHPIGADVTSQLLRNLERFAEENNFLLTRREPEAERRLGELDVYELGITCSWDANLSALVRFLYALQSQGANVDIRQLTVAPVQGSPERLRGNFTVDYAYSRQGPDT